MVSRHLDSNPKNNNLENLKWGTVQQNVLNSVAIGTHICMRKGEEKAVSKMTEQGVRQSVYMHRTGLFTLKEIGDMFNVTAANICNIVNKKTWGHIWTA